MKRVLGILLGVALVLTLAACGSASNSGTTWQEQYDLGVQYLTDGDYEAAIVAFTAAIEIDAKDIQAYTGLVQAYIGKGDYDAAASVAGQGAEILGDSGQEQPDGAVDEFTAVLLTLGELCLEDGQYELAVTMFSLVIEINPELVDAYIRRAEVYVMLAEVGATAGDGQESTEEESDEKQKALEDYQKALELIREGENGSLTEDELEDLIEELKGTTSAETDNAITPAEADDTIATYLSGNVMQAYDGDKGWGYSSTLPGNEDILRMSIRSITVLDSLEDMPEDAWDISQEGDGSVMAWVIESDDYDDLPDSYYYWATILYDFYIAGEGGVDAPENSHYLFGGYKFARTMDLTYLYTDLVTDMSNMFEMPVDGKELGAADDDVCLEYLDISGFDTFNVTDMSSMFYGCGKLEELDVSRFRTENVTDMSNMFGYCNGLSELNISNFDTSKVKDMSHMFFGCRELVILDVSNFQTENVTDMSGMFLECWNLSSMDLSNFNTKNVTDMSTMFMDCIAVTYLNVSSFNTENVLNMACMFEYCENMISLDVSSFNTSSVTNMSYMFGACENLTSLDVSGFDTSNCCDMSNMFLDCKKLSVDISEFDFSLLSYVTDYSAYLGLTN